MAPSTVRVTNRLLDRLSKKDRTHVLSGCEEVELSFGEVLADAGAPVRNVYFPTGSTISLVVPMGAESMLEVALAGSEGLCGVSVALGLEASPLRALVQGPGTAWQMGAAVFRRELETVPALRECVNRYVYVLMAQITQSAGCNRFHPVEQRVARWLLMTGDRAHIPTFAITHEFMGSMLGVRRVGITEAASALQTRRLIRYSRGLITILDRKGLEGAACPCYRADLSVYKRAFA